MKSNALIICIFFVSVAIVGAQPTQQIDGGLFYFPPMQSLITIGGWGPEDWQPLSTAWALTADGWNQLPDLPAGITHTTAAYDPNNQHLVVVGGVLDQQATYAFDGSSWEKIADPVQSDIIGGDPEIIFDPGLGTFVMFYAAAPFQASPPPGTTYFLENDEWIQQEISPSPPAAVDVAFVYDEAREEGVWFDGKETWVWKNQSWINKNPASAPTYEFGDFNMVYDAARENCLLYGKEQQTWIWNGENWSQLSPPNVPDHPDRGFFAMGFDASRDVVVLFGGELIVDPNTYEAIYLEDLWEWNGTNWHSFNETPVQHWFHQ